MFNKLFSWLGRLFETPKYTPVELVLKSLEESNNHYTWTTYRRLTPEEIQHWKEMSEFAEKHNLPKIWGVTIEEKKDERN